jgi:N utilization substance protein B
MMGNRRKSRELAMQALFYMDTQDRITEESLDHYCSNFEPPANARHFFLELVKGVIVSKSRLDAVIERFSSNWKIHRMSGVDRNVLRLAVFEILFREDIPTKVSINEAIDIGKKYGTEESGAFINGILDGIRLALEKDEIQTMTLDSSDNFSKRCPRLGGPVPLSYCMQSGEGSLPCFKVIDCWWQDFDIQTYLGERLTQDEFDRLINSKPPAKVASLVELIEQAKKLSPK